MIRVVLEAGGEKEKEDPTKHSFVYQPVYEGSETSLQRAESCRPRDVRDIFLT